MFESWIDKLQNKDADISSFYAQTVNYYKATNYLKVKIIGDKSKIWTKYTSFKIIATNVNISMVDETTYKVSYSKHFEAVNDNNGKTFNGDANSVVIFKKNDDKWEITTEKDI
jgi:hypothetical protein